MSGDFWARETDPATPPWRTVRFWLALSALTAAVAALVTRGGWPG